MLLLCYFFPVYASIQIQFIRPRVCSEMYSNLKINPTLRFVIIFLVIEFSERCKLGNLTTFDSSQSQVLDFGSGPLLSSTQRLLVQCADVILGSAGGLVGRAYIVGI